MHMIGYDWIDWNINWFVDRCICVHWFLDIFAHIRVKYGYDAVVLFQILVRFLLCIDRTKRGLNKQSRRCKKVYQSKSWKKWACPRGPWPSGFCCSFSFWSWCLSLFSWAFLALPTPTSSRRSSTVCCRSPVHWACRKVRLMSRRGCCCCVCVHVSLCLYDCITDRNFVMIGSCTSGWLQHELHAWMMSWHFVAHWTRLGWLWDWSQAVVRKIPKPCAKKRWSTSRRCLPCSARSCESIIHWRHARSILWFVWWRTLVRPCVSVTVPCQSKSWSPWLIMTLVWYPGPFDFIAS